MKLVAIVAVVAATSLAASEDTHKPDKKECAASGFVLMAAVEMAKKYQEFCYDTTRSKAERDAACTAFVETVNAMKPMQELLEENCPAE